MRHRHLITVSLVALSVFSVTTIARGLISASLVPGPQPDGTALTPIGQSITPAGVQATLVDGQNYADRPLGLAVSPDGATILVSNNGVGTQSLMVVDSASASVKQTIPYQGPDRGLFVGVTYSADGKTVYASGGGSNDIHVYKAGTDGRLSEDAPIRLPVTGGRSTVSDKGPFPAGIAVSGDGRELYIAENLADQLAVVDTSTRSVVATIPTGAMPYGVAVSKDGALVFVSNWNGSTVTAVDTRSRVARAQIPVGTHPNALAIAPLSGDLYVANGDSDSVSVVNTSTLKVRRTITLSPFRNAPAGSSPNALAFSPDGTTLFVANAGNNDVVVVDTRSGLVRGALPVGWYPSAIGVAPDGSRLFVLNTKGLGAGPNPSGPNPVSRKGVLPSQAVISMIRGTLSLVTLPISTSQLRSYTAQVARNNGFALGSAVRRADLSSVSVLPRRVGAPTPLKHVIYVIKENRTYDQELGSLGRGNGDPSLNLFGDDVAPNTRELAREYVTLDNYYAAAEVSATGWSWSTEATANSYSEKLWPSTYSGRNRGYDFEGDTSAIAAGRDSKNSFIWDRLAQAGISFRNYGVFARGDGPVTVDSSEPALSRNTDLRYPGFDLQLPDQVRIDEWLREFQQFESLGRLPTVEFVRLPGDHTAGTLPGYRTPSAMVADNDLALGRLVETVTHSRFWGSTAILVTEDDAQNGPDHIDAHRTVGLVISPYSRLGTVDSTMYSTPSMLRTLELIVGIPPLTQFDAAATPMYRSLGRSADLTPYVARTPTQSLTDVNTARSPMAKVSATLKLAGADEADEYLLNEAVWKSVRGRQSSMPTPRHVPLSRR